MNKTINEKAVLKDYVKESTGRPSRSIDEFLVYLRGPGGVHTEKRIQKYVTHLTQWTAWAGMPIEFITERELNASVAALNKSGYKPWTIHDYLVSLKRYLRFIKRHELADCLRVRTPALIPVDERDMLTESDVLAICRANSDIVYQTVPWVLFDLGVRPSELTGLNVGDVRDEPPYLRFVIRGVPGARKNDYAPRNVDTRLPETIRRMKAYLAWHPQRDNPSAPLFLNSIGTRLHTRTMWGVITQTAKALGIKKWATSKQYRKASRSTLYSKLSNSAAERRYGHVRGTRMHAIYNCSGDDAVRAELTDITPSAEESHIKFTTAQVIEQLKASPEFKILIEEALGYVKIADEWDDGRAQGLSPISRAPWSGSARNGKSPNIHSSSKVAGPLDSPLGTRQPQTRRNHPQEARP